MEVLKLKKNNLNSIIQQAAREIKQGQILVCPTDTVYGLICDAANGKAVRRLYLIKKRPKDKLIPIFVKDFKMAKKLAEIDPEQEKFLKQVWPGSITAVFHYKKQALRIPNYKLLLRLIKFTGPLAETSANLSGQSASTKIKEVLKYFEGKKYQPDLVLDAGNLRKSKPSKVVDLTVYPYKIIRK
jgi:L-threonylcarbamoyladenylate synthase